MNARTHLDLFSGIGGFSLAAESCGFKTVAFCEIDPQASLVLKAHWPDVPNLVDVKKLHGHEYLKSFGVPYLITGGVPCQPASALGQMRGTSDERWLWPEAIRIMRELRPRFGIFENPPSILILEGGRAWNGIVSGLVACGYDCWWDVFPAAAFGAGHLRERVILTVADASISGRKAWPGLCESGQTGKRSASGEDAAHSEHMGRACGNKRGDRSEGSETGNARTHADAAVAIRDSKIAGNPNLPGLQGHSGNGSGSGEQGQRGTDTRRHAAPPDLRGRVRDFGNGKPWWYEANTGVPVLAHGLSSKLVEAATRCAGNAIVPQVAAEIIRAMIESESGDHAAHF